jgi:hypothetical protein
MKNAAASMWPKKQAPQSNMDVPITAAIPMPTDA